MSVLKIEVKIVDLPHVSWPCMGAVSLPSSIFTRASPCPVTIAVWRASVSDAEGGAGLGSRSSTCSGKSFVTDKLGDVCRSAHNHTPCHDLHSLLLDLIVERPELKLDP
jgi:hypothetical protein